MSRYLYLAAAVLALYAGQFVFVHAQDWRSILPDVPSPKAKPLESARIVESRELTGRQELGQRLFFDPVLSHDGKRTCATCHDPDRGFASHGRPVGVDGYLLPRRAPSLIGKADSKSLFWDGRAASLEDQCREVLLNQKEMGNRSMKEILDRVAATKDYFTNFSREYRNGLSENSLTHAISEFERTIQNTTTGFEDYLNGRPSTFTAGQRRGFELFRGKAHCYQCHSVTRGGRLTDENYHNTGLRGNDPGRSRASRRDEDEGKFKTPGLRGCSLTAPYMHDGSLKTLRDVVDFYDRGGDREGYLGAKDFRIVPLHLSEREKSDLVELLKGL